VRLRDSLKLKKNLKGEHWRAIHLRLSERELSGKPSLVLLNGRALSKAKISRERRRYRNTADRYLRPSKYRNPSVLKCLAEMLYRRTYISTIGHCDPNSQPFPGLKRSSFRIRSCISQACIRRPPRRVQFHCLPYPKLFCGVEQPSVEPESFDFITQNRISRGTSFE
jgi:hypothetical protein